MNPLTVRLIASVIRHIVGAVGGGTAMFSEDEMQQLAGAIALIVSLAWSAVEKYRTHQVAQR